MNKMRTLFKGFAWLTIIVAGARWVDLHCWKRYIPMNGKCCQGCVTVSVRGMNYLWKLVNSEEKKLLLWSYESMRQ